jgi:hypothetical protein
MSYFVKGYDGEPTADAIRTAAIDAGFMSPPDHVSTDELAAHQRVAAAASGANAPGELPIDQAIAEAKNADEVMSILEREGYPTVRNRPG